MRIAHSVVKCVRSGPVFGAVKWSSNKNNIQNFLTPVTAVTTAPMGVTTLAKLDIRLAVWVTWQVRCYNHRSTMTVLVVEMFLLGTGRMLHLVGGAMGVT